MVPGQLGDVHQAVDAAQVHEGAEVHDGGNVALRRMPLESLERISARSFLRPSSKRTRRDSTTLLRLRSISMTRASISVPGRRPDPSRGAGPRETPEGSRAGRCPG